METIEFMYTEYYSYQALLKQFPNEMQDLLQTTKKGKVTDLLTLLDSTIKSVRVMKAGRRARLKENNMQEVILLKQGAGIAAGIWQVKPTAIFRRKKKYVLEADLMPLPNASEILSLKCCWYKLRYADCEYPIGARNIATI